MYVLEEIILFLEITHRIYFKYNDLLHTLNVYTIPAKKHEAFDS